MTTPLTTPTIMPTYDVTAYGAVGDGRTRDTAAIQAALDAAGAAGGGRVVLPAGRTFLSGSVRIPSYVDLHVERGAVLQGSGDWADLTERFDVGALSAGVVTERTDPSAALVVARDAVEVAITGDGVIDGAGAAYVTGTTGDIHDLPNTRPFLVFLVGCRGVTVRDVTLRDSALWTLRLTGCEDVLVHGIRVRADERLPNSDGIDLDRCRRVRVSDCDLVCGDDGISLKTCDEWPEHGPCEDVVVSNCVIRTRSSGVVVGVDVSAPIRRVVVTGCVIDAHRGLSVTVGTGVDGWVEDVLFSDVVVTTRLYSERWWGSAEAVFVRSAPWHGEEVGTIRDVRFRNVLARGEGGAVVYAARPGLVDGVDLQDVRLELTRTTAYPPRRDLRPRNGEVVQHPEPLPAVYVENATGVRLRDCEVRAPAGTPAVQQVDAEVTVTGLRERVTG